jgi:streptomycin 6-kinase
MDLREWWPRVDLQGWLAIDPKCIVGDRAFDFANILCNPSAGTALRPGRLACQVEVMPSATGIPADRLLRWTMAGRGLSATWLELGDQPPGHVLEVGAAAGNLLAMTKEA